MEHLSLEIFDLGDSTGSKYANLPENASITITDTSEIFASGDVWSHSFTLNIPANAHIFGTSGEMHGSRLHEQINKRRARLWVEGLPLFLGYLKLDDEVEVDVDGNVDVKFESGQKTFDELIDGVKAREVSVGDVVIGVALNRKRTSWLRQVKGEMTLNGLEAFAVKYDIGDIATTKFEFTLPKVKTPYVQRWPKLVKSQGKVFDSSWTEQNCDYTNVQSPYDASHPFCNINICYPLKVDDNGEEKVGRSYTMRLAHGEDTTDGGDNQTRFNNAPNFYLLYFIDRLFKDLGIHIDENQALGVEDLKRVFMLNYGCHYEEFENDSDYTDNPNIYNTPSSLVSRYGQYYMPIISKDDKNSLVKGWDSAGEYVGNGSEKGLDVIGKVLLRNVRIAKRGDEILTLGSIEGVVQSLDKPDSIKKMKNLISLAKTDSESKNLAYPAYLAYATGDNYPNVEISEIINAMKSMFGIRFLFSENYKRVRIVLLKNVFENADVQTLDCDIVEDAKTENSVRGFRMTYGKGEDDTNYYYKGFNDLFPRASSTWKDTTDTHDYSQWRLNAEYDEIKQSVSVMNRICYVTPVNGNAYGVKVDDDEDVLFPTLLPYADFMDAEDGDCTEEDTTIEEVQCGASPVVMNEVDGTYASLFSGDLKAPAPNITGDPNTTDGRTEIDQCWEKTKSWLATFGRMTLSSQSFYGSSNESTYSIQGDLDVFIAEGFRIRLLDNYAVSNGGTPFDEADPGLQFGIMRGSGDDAYIFAAADKEESEGNDYWEVVPGKGAIAHCDTCDHYGNLWNYTGGTATITTSAQAKTAMTTLWPNSNFALTSLASRSYLISAMIMPTLNDSNQYVNLLMASKGYSGVPNYSYNDLKTYTKRYLKGKTAAQMLATDKTSNGGLGVLIEVDSSYERKQTLLALQRLAYADGAAVTLSKEQGTSTTDGRFSLKLRAEKLNPYYGSSKTGVDTTSQYLPITTDVLRRRGLIDFFYKEYSFFIRNARIANLTVRMTLAQLLSIDKTVRVTVGDITGFVRKMEYSISNQDGLGLVTMEIMYV